MPEVKYVSTDQVAEMVNVSVATVRRWTREKMMPRPFKCGRTIRFREPEILRWIAEQEGREVSTCD